jgi:hypothetical protein
MFGTDMDGEAIGIRCTTLHSGCPHASYEVNRPISDGRMATLSTSLTRRQADAFIAGQAI